MTEQAHIIKGCKHNDRKSQEKLYMQAYPALYNMCRRFFDDEHDILSAVNNGMLRVFKNIDQYDTGKAELSTWMYTIVRNEALTMVRNKRSVTGTQELTAELSSEMMVNPFVKAAESEVLDYLKHLTDSTRAAFSLFYIEGYSIKEIAGSLDMKEGTVKWHLHEGRKKLQSILKKNNSRIANAG